MKWSPLSEVVVSGRSKTTRDMYDRFVRSSAYPTIIKKLKVKVLPAHLVVLFVLHAITRLQGAVVSDLEDEGKRTLVNRPSTHSTAVTIVP